MNETRWSVQRATSTTGPSTTVGTDPSTTGPSTGTAISFTDNTVARRTTCYCQVLSNNVVGY